MDNGGNFRKFDYGKDANMAIYGQSTPPEIPIENINVPVAIFNGSLDSVVLPEGVNQLIEKLGDNMVFHQEIEADHWTFSMAQDMSWYQNNLIAVLQTFNPTGTARFSQFLH